MTEVTIQPVGRINPAHPTESEQYQDDGWTYVLWKVDDAATHPTRVISSVGSLRLHLDDVVRLRDETGEQLGEYRVVGRILPGWTDLVHGDDGDTGELPDRSIRHALVVNLKNTKRADVG